MMKKIIVDQFSDPAARQAHEEAVASLVSDPRVIGWLQHNHQNRQFLESCSGALSRWVQALDACAGCKGLNQCRQPLKGRVLNLYMSDGFLEEEYVPCRLQKRVADRRAHGANFRLRHGKDVDLEIDLDSLDVSGEDREYLLAFTKVVRSYDGGRGVFLFGQPGTGKTYLLTGMANKYARKGHRTSFVNVPLLCQDLRQSLEDADYRDDVMNALKYSEVLFLDDLGSEHITRWTRDEVLFPVLDFRMNTGRKTYFSSNYTLDELLDQYAQPGDRVAALRLLERVKTLGESVNLKGVSRRAKSR